MLPATGGYGIVCSSHNTSTNLPWSTAACSAFCAVRISRAIFRHTLSSADVMFVRSFFANPKTKIPKDFHRKRMIALNPPDFPSPLRLSLCLNTPPPRFASTVPADISAMARHNSESAIWFFRVKRAKSLLLKIRKWKPDFHEHYNTKCYRNKCYLMTPRWLLAMKSAR